MKERIDRTKKGRDTNGYGFMPAKRRDLLLPNDSEGSYWVLSNQGVTRGKRETKTLAAGRIKAWRHNKAAPPI